MSVFRIDTVTGHVSLTAMVPALGHQPRYLCVSPDGSELLVAHERSNSVISFPIDPSDGSLGNGVERVQTGSPVCVLMLP